MFRVCTPGDDHMCASARRNLFRFVVQAFQLLLPNAVAIAGGIFPLLPVQDVDVACV
jgi:hypothetical protein